MRYEVNSYSLPGVLDAYQCADILHVSVEKVFDAIEQGILSSHLVPGGCYLVYANDFVSYARKNGADVSKIS